MKYTVKKQVEIDIDPGMFMEYLKTNYEDLPKIVDKMDMNTLSYIAAYYVGKCERDDPEQYAKFKKFLPKSVYDEKEPMKESAPCTEKSNKKPTTTIEIGNTVFVKHKKERSRDFISIMFTDNAELDYWYDRWEIVDIFEESAQKIVCMKDIDASFRREKVAYFSDLEKALKSGTAIMYKN